MKETDEKILLTIDRQTFIKVLIYAYKHNVEFLTKSGGITKLLKHITKDISIPNRDETDLLLEFGFVPKEYKGGLVPLNKQDSDSKEESQDALQARREAIRHLTRSKLKE